MGTYEVTITNWKKGIPVLLGLCVLMIVLLFTLMELFFEYLDPFLTVILTMLPTYLVWRLLKKIPVEFGEIQMDSKKVQFNFPSFEAEYELADISSYRITIHRGCTLVLHLEGGLKKTINCNDNFSDPTSLELFCQDFENVVNGHNDFSRNHIDRRKSFYDKKWALPLIIVITVGCIGMIGFALITGGRIPATIISSLGVALTMWASYWTAKRKMK